MSKLREGDIVTIRARVLRVAPYDDGQQIMARLLPNGEQIGWLLQKETAFEPAELMLKVGDTVKFDDRPGHAEGWEIKAIFDNDQIAVQKHGHWPVEMADAKRARRV